MLLPTSIIAVLPGTWPAVNVPPPANANYTKLVNISKIRNAPTTKPNATTPTCPTTDTYCYWTCSLCTRNDTDIVNCPNKLDWGLTLDDGPTSFTTSVLDYLDTQNVKVTFFVIGSNVYQNPDILLRAFKAGHQIGVHTWSHTALTSQSNEVVIAELKYTLDAIKAATNVTPKYMRPPFGDYDDRIRDISTQLGMKPTIWDLDTNDWLSNDDKSFQLSWITANFTQWVSDPALKTTGHISLEHDLYNQTAAQIPLVVPILKKANYSIKPVHECIGDPYPYVENVTLAKATTTTTTTTTTQAPTPTPEITPTQPNVVTTPTHTQKTSDATIIFKSDLLSLSFVVVLFFVSLFY
ncbi:glycoside hydrolase/deacetylase [Gigaspora margarita]|uniref:Glycoside hydrolase/deacetylase n=1 Tax=Gigaspora margarita TaxID=4874 RepID=A0A8H4AME6_GIGMA|nr:glycoside hydrolase/deacetylase [Gigaspora margarita]